MIVEKNKRGNGRMSGYIRRGDEYLHPLVRTCPTPIFDISLRLCEILIFGQLDLGDMSDV